MQGQPGLMSLEVFLSLHISLPGPLRWRRTETRRENSGQSTSWGSGHRGQPAGPPAACGCPRGEGWESRPGVGGAAGRALRLPPPPQEMLGEGNSPQLQLDAAGGACRPRGSSSRGRPHGGPVSASGPFLPERPSRPCSGVSCTCREPARLGRFAGTGRALRSDRWASFSRERAPAC